ncbi:MAG: serine/threonine-protein kinase, partial [Gemmatimonadales bacterium]
MADIPGRLATALADRYPIERELGSGGMAVVYLAHDLKHDRSVALKVLRSDYATTVGSERFLREIDTAARLAHPHILPLYDSGEADGFLYYVMPYAEGESLRDRLNREKRLPIEDAIQITREVAEALGYAHERGVVHRDIKPENILLEAGEAVVADFGIARAISAAAGDTLTASGVIIGTPQYMSPEQATGDSSLDSRTDIYALGCVLHEMLAGAPPFTGRTVPALVAQHVSENPPALRAVRPEVPPWLENITQTALKKLPADRFPTAQALSQSLAAQARPRIRLAPMWRRWARRVRRRPAVAALGAIAVGLAAAYFVLDWRVTRRGSDEVSDV